MDMTDDEKAAEQGDTKVVTEVRMSYRFGVNRGVAMGVAQTQTDVGATVRSLQARVERETMGPVGVTKVETSVVTTTRTPWTEVTS